MNSIYESNPSTIANLVSQLNYNQKFIDLTIQQATNSKMNFMHGAVLVSKNRVISSACNDNRNYTKGVSRYLNLNDNPNLNSCRCSTHAEVNCLLKTRRRVLQRSYEKRKYKVSKCEESNFVRSSDFSRNKFSRGKFSRGKFSI